MALAAHLPGRVRGRAFGRRRHACISAHAMRAPTGASLPASYERYAAAERERAKQTALRLMDDASSAHSLNAHVRPPHRTARARAVEAAAARSRRRRPSGDDERTRQRANDAAQRSMRARLPRGGASGGARFCAAMDRRGGGGCIACYVLRASCAAAAGGEGPRDAAASAAGPQHFGNCPGPPQAMAMAMAFRSLQGSKANPTGRACGRASPT